MLILFTRYLFTHRELRLFAVHKNLTLIPGQTRTSSRKPSDNRHLLDTTASEKFGDFECVGTTVASTKKKAVKISSATLSHHLNVLTFPPPDCGMFRRSRMSSDFSVNTAVIGLPGDMLNFWFHRYPVPCTLGELLSDPVKLRF